MIFLHLRHAPVLAAALIIALTTSGCSSKNPLIDNEPAPATLGKNEAVPDKPVLPKPPLVVKPAEDSKPANETKPAAVKPVVSAPISLIEDQNKSKATGTERWLGIFKPYKPNVQQGNFVSNDMAAKLRPGMSKEQVRFVLGTPLLTDLFHADRWDYLFRLQKPDGELTTNRIAVFFKDDRVERIQSSNLPSESEYLSHIAGPVENAKPEATPTKPAAPASQPST